MILWGVLLGFIKTLFVSLLHILAAYLLVFWGLVFLAKWTGVPEVAPVVALFFSLPILMTGILRTSFSSYREIPALGWVGAGMMVSVGTVFLVAIIISKP